MGLFDSIVSGALRGALQDGGAQGLPNLLSQVLGQTGLGSIGGLLAQLQQSGLGGQVGSWLSNNPNMPISVDQLRSALGDRHLQEVAQASGLPINDLLAMLSKHLPSTVDTMSLNGTLQEDDATPQDDDAGGGSLADQAGLGDVKA